MPDLSFTEDENAVANYDKYFVFHRKDTEFAEALQDIRECDARARGLWGGAVAKRADIGASSYGFGSGVVQALILGPAQERLARRASLRRCMFYKGYSRFGLAAANWEKFNFQRPDGDLEERDIQRMLALLALVASGPRPHGRDLGL